MYHNALKTEYNSYRESHLNGRYITGSRIAPLLKKLGEYFKIYVEGSSVQKRPIHSIQLGNGIKRILIWSQMHGNESTTTKSIFDLINFLKVNNSILESCTLLIIPILNPDGAEVYTRLNANAVDLNRDAQALTQPESRILHECFHKFRPDFCFNLHGQRTIFSVGATSKPATVSFLSPAENEARTVTNTRKIAMELIVSMNAELQKLIPNQIALYDDGFNLNCVGDTFQALGVPTVLFEAGHFENDYNREETRFFIYHALVVALNTIASHELTGSNYQDYFSVPQNDKCFFDLIIRNAMHSGERVDIAVQYQERLEDGKILFVPKIEKMERLNGFFGHKEYDADGNAISNIDMSSIEAGQESDFIMLNNAKYSLLKA
ncbi:DUF2817 domain-containing protein [Bizionia myxarmorum]|uniref:DUF2817 domain-containing protein n=2 Tax=Bizionia myxarmorum TaxID=291186 RepID=A0A5D0R6E6_9FLAO|nr:DUF2817 domain-containing protein [Bizionia myxarmorum]